MIRQLTLAEAEYIAHELALRHLSEHEPLPPFHSRHPGRLESCLNHPFQTVGGRYVYHFLYQRAAILFYLVIKNHPFQNGNKRMAVTLTIVFLYINGRWLKIDPIQLYHIAKGVAESSPADKEKVVAELGNLLKEHLIPANNNR